MGLIISVVGLIIAWCVVIWCMASFKMVLHAFSISYEKKHRVFVKRLGTSLDIALVLSVIYVVGVILYFIFR